MISIVLAAALAVGQPQPVITVDPSHRLIEGVATDGQKIWLSSLMDRQILECAGTCRTIATLPNGLHPFAIAWDGDSTTLWVAADCPPGVSFITACERGALLGLDSRGRLLKRVSLPSGTFHPGDVSASGGKVFVSDSQNGAVYRLGEDRKSLIAVVPPGVGKSGQGTALSADGERLLIADYSQGIAEVDLATGSRTLLPRQDSKPLRGVDGLVRCGPIHLGVYNGDSPGALLTITRREGGIEYGELVTDLALPDPTQVAFDGTRVLVVADSGWAIADKPEPRAKGATILAIPVSADCRPIKGERG